MMKTYHYKVIRELLWHRDIGLYFSYGFDVMLDGKRVKRISDIHARRNFVRELAEECNRRQIPLDQIIDYISERLP